MRCEWVWLSHAVRDHRKPRLGRVACDDRDPMSAGLPDRRAEVFASVPASARAARAFVSKWLQHFGAADDVVGTFQLAVSELVTNVIEHANAVDFSVSVDAVDPDWWQVKVSCGSSLLILSADPLTWSVAPPHLPSGRGLGIVRQLIDEIAVNDHDGSVSIRCRVRRLRLI